MQLQGEDHDGLFLINAQEGNYLQTLSDAMNKSVQL